MAIRLTCRCGTGLEIRDEDAGEVATCPRCGAVVYRPPQASVDTSIDPPAPPPKRARDRPALDPRARQRRRQIKARRKSLRWVDRGLVLHYFTPFLFLGGTAAGLLAVVLTVSARSYDWEAAADAAWFFFPVS